ncbi:hypothetical protein [Xanthomonas translucens]|uniref:hypothetical protein n=1 Tax=Xanthomonas campestris pv. translucens TaxID=343 RepID=UPI0011120933|nr:hypothetical protein [Xanthomonas translucens]QEO28104.1 hypothetical protein F0H32_19750 [Xanthomonas translucens pv. undulosa]WLA08526.1 hypothetical protein MO328_19795 [Xanthomonas translucens]
MPSDTQIRGGGALLSTTISLSKPAWVYVQSDGRYYPGPPDGKSLGSAFITVDGSKVSNDSVIDWRQSSAKQQHSFNVVGAAYLGAGDHTVNLNAATDGSSVYYGAGSNLSVVVDAASHISLATLAGDTPAFNFDTSNTPEGTALPEPRGRSTVLTAYSDAGGKTVAMASGRSYVYGAYGDAMYGIFKNNAEPNIDSMTWSINDLYSGAETQAPMYSQALFDVTSAGDSIQLVASESPYYKPVASTTNSVKYRVGAGTSLVVLSGGMSVVGKGLSSTFPYQSMGGNSRFSYLCAGSSSGSPGCPQTDSEFIIGQGQVCVPAGHNGVLMFSSKTRVQGDTADSGGTVSLYLKIDGQRRGVTGIQQLGPKPNAVSTRTISTSYLATGVDALSAGCHTVQLATTVSGSFLHLTVNPDMPIVWFD